MFEKFKMCETPSQSPPPQKSVQNYFYREKKCPKPQVPPPPQKCPKLFYREIYIVLEKINVSKTPSLNPSKSVQKHFYREKKCAIIQVCPPPKCVQNYFYREIYKF